MTGKIAGRGLPFKGGIIVFLLIAVASDYPGTAVARESNRPGSLDTCMKSKDARDGIGSAFTDCYRDELGREEARLNAVYRALRKRLSPARFAMLRASERQWIARTNKKCWGDPPRNEGTDGVNDSILCLTSETQKRTDWLHAYKAG